MKKREKIACIYKATNLINNKIYIGSTGDFYRRLKYHLQYKNSGCTFLVKALNKYGKENFKWETLELIDLSTKSKKESRKILEEREQYYLDTLLFAQEYIRKENNKFLKLGYNLNPLASSCAFRKEINSDHKKTKVIAYDKSGNLYKIYNSMQEASIDTGDLYQSVIQCCLEEGNISNRKRKYIYRYYIEEYLNTIEIKNKYKNKKINKNHKSHQKINQYNLKGEFIAEYSSISEASRIVYSKYLNNSIKRHAINNTPFKEFIWKFKEETNKLIKQN